MAGERITHTMNSLVLGPLLRYVDETSASIWVETETAGRVTVTAGEHRASAPTFGVHGHHYALICLEGLPAGSKLPYQVWLDDQQVWPPADSPYPASLIPTLSPDKPLRLAFGSCRTAVDHQREGNETHGFDALRVYALRMAGVTNSRDPRDPDPADEARWPDLLLFLGDQVYADETTAPMREFIESRRDIEQPPWTELQDYQEYAHLYRLAWSEEANRWLLSTLPSAMIFDDHDIRDDWNTSLTWKHQMEATEWWHGRIVAGLASYWVYQHLGNLSPAERRDDRIWQEITTAGDQAEQAHQAAQAAQAAQAHETAQAAQTEQDSADPPAAEYDASALLDRFAEEADQAPEVYRWSFTRDFGAQARLIVVDSRAARVLEPEHRSMLDKGEMAWLDEAMQGGFDHVLIGTSLPFLLAPGLHYVEAFTEALAGGGWGRRAARVGEKIRQKADLEHWAAFQSGFLQVCGLALAVARGERGPAPGTVTFLSGDVHHSYVSEAVPRGQEARGAALQSRILQAVCSPIRNPLPRSMRYATAVLSYGVAGPIGKVVARSAKVPDAPITWQLVEGPWFDNNLATLEVRGRRLRMWWATGSGEAADPSPRLERVAEFTT